MYNLKKLLITFVILAISAYVTAYELSFYNNAKDPIAIAIQYAESELEPLYKQYIKPHSMKSFVPGTTVDIPDIKWSFCLKNLYYAKNPTMEDRAHYFAKTVWHPISITWTDEPLAHEPKKIPKLRKKITQTPQKPDHMMVTKKQIVKDDEKSLCKDRHFEIMEDQDGHISVVASTKSKL